MRAEVSEYLPREERRQRTEDRGRTLPQAREAEGAVLGCVLLDPDYALNEAEERGAVGEWFYSMEYRLVWEAAAELHKAGKLVDLVTLSQHLTEHQPAPGDQNWMAIVMALPDLAVSAANVGSYLEILEAKHLERSLVQTGTELVAGVFEVDQKLTAKDLLAQVERKILRLGEESAAERERHIKDVILKVMEDFEDYHRGHAQIRGIATTGLEYLDKLLGGIGGRNGNYFVLSARPGIGKTSLATQVAAHAAIEHAWFEPVLENGKPVMEKLEDGRERFKCERKQGMPVGIFSLEMAEDALVERMLFQRARGDMQRWRTGFAKAQDMEALAKSAAALSKAGIYIDDTGRCTVDSLKARARRMHRQWGCKLFVIDYIQLMKSGGKRFRDDRVQELSDISAEIQCLGKELNVPFVVLAQMNRDFEKDPTRRPRLSDLKDCGSIEQDADAVMFLYKPKLSDRDAEQYDAAMAEVYGKDWSGYPQRINGLVAKNRYGPDGVVQLLFQRSCTMFMDYNEWLKKHGHKALAMGESRSKTRAEDLPTNEEMDV